MARPAPSEPILDEESAESLYDGPSKSQRKRDMLALQDLGIALTELGKEQWKKLDLPEALLTALADAKKITAHGALKRQRQYIGKLMRDVDPVPIQAYLDTLKGDNDVHNAWLHHLERTREALLASDDAFSDLLAEHPDVDIPDLRQLVRNARAERGTDKPPKHYRALFQFLKELYPEPALVAALDDGDDEEDDDDDA